MRNNKRLGEPFSELSAVPYVVINYSETKTSEEVIPKGCGLTMDRGSTKSKIKGYGWHCLNILTTSSDGAGHTLAKSRIDFYDSYRIKKVSLKYGGYMPFKKEIIDSTVDALIDIATFWSHETRTYYIMTRDGYYHKFFDDAQREMTPVLAFKSKSPQVFADILASENNDIIRASNLIRDIYGI